MIIAQTALFRTAGSPYPGGMGLLGLRKELHMKIGFIGAGKVGTAFGRYLKENRVEVLGYFSRSASSAKKAALFTDTLCLSLGELVAGCEYIFITTPDDAIASVWNQIKDFNIEDKKIFHMSGSLSSHIFCGIEDCRAYGYSLHPLFPFSHPEVFKELQNAFFTIEGRNLNLIQDFLDAAKIKHFPIQGENKAKYHAAAVFASNYIVCLAEISKEILIQCGMPRELEKSIYPLLAGAVNNIANYGIDRALTGPIVRGDTGTVKKHLEALTDYQDLYRSLGKVAVSLSYKRGAIGENKRNELNKLLEE
ncbi:MAG: DUF2520 domain-containing protein [Clostridiales bacterium]|jgi:predicted short-subunit dehydrogenase-like oxidoreductase (DUF2520 family)|nr:DUF2520 domain-containing protein [Eubacteriales bacterium]MDH7565398.1 DUF2520 domain-containing protein [Clostridiales bacterium]